MGREKNSIDEIAEVTIADTLYNAWLELRRIPIGGRGHILDAMFEAQAELRKQRAIALPDSGIRAFAQASPRSHAHSEAERQLTGELKMKLREGTKAKLVLVQEEVSTGIKHVEAHRLSTPPMT